jgi:hypothetical protein
MRANSDAMCGRSARVTARISIEAPSRRIASTGAIVRTCAADGEVPAPPGSTSGRRPAPSAGVAVAISVVVMEERIALRRPCVTTQRCLRSSRRPSQIVRGAWRAAQNVRDRG